MGVSSIRIFARQPDKVVICSLSMLCFTICFINKYEGCTVFFAGIVPLDVSDHLLQFILVLSEMTAFCSSVRLAQFPEADHAISKERRAVLL